VFSFLTVRFRSDGPSDPHRPESVHPALGTFGVLRQRRCSDPPRPAPFALHLPLDPPVSCSICRSFVAISSRIMDISVPFWKRNSLPQTKSPLSGGLSRCSVAGSRAECPAHSGSSQCRTTDRHSSSQSHRAIQRLGAAQCLQTGRDFPDDPARASRKPTDGFPGLWTKNPTRPVLDDLWWPSLRFPGPCWIEEREGRDARPVKPASLSALCSTPGPAGPLGASLWRDALRPDISAPARRAAEGKGGAAWRRDRSRAQPRAAPGFGREHGEHGEDPPLARSEHRGTTSTRGR
jgi:hypothetical protein